MEQSQPQKKTHRDDGGMAFPGFDYVPGHGPAKAGQNGYEVYQSGMTLRDYFAVKALQGMLAHHPDIAPLKYEVAAAGAYHYADAMIAERAK